MQSKEAGSKSNIFVHFSIVNLYQVLQNKDKIEKSINFGTTINLKIRHGTKPSQKMLLVIENMTDHPIVTRNNKGSNFILNLIIAGIAIVLFFSIYQSLAYKTFSFNAINISVMIGVWGLILWLEIRRRKSISIYPDYITINSKNGHKKKFNTRDVYLNIVKHSAQSLKSTRTLQLRKKGSHRKIICIEPLNRKDDKYLEDILKNTCGIKVDNWVE